MKDVSTEGYGGCVTLSHLFHPLYCPCVRLLKWVLIFGRACVFVLKCRIQEQSICTVLPPTSGRRDDTQQHSL